VQKFASGHKAASGPLAVAQGRVTVAIVGKDERAHVRIKGILAQAQDFYWVGSYSSGEAALTGIPQSGAQIVLMDIKMSGMSGIECTKRLKSMMPCLKIVMVSRFHEPEAIKECLQAGADSILSKPISADQCLATLISTVFGDTRRESKMREVKKDAVGGSAIDPALTPRENEVMACFAEGMPYKEAASKLGISESTVHHHQHEIYLKYRVTNKIEAFARWQERRRT
jgi:two-component system, NarL family, nitrate/nitrite response regulator NarL